MMRRLSARVDLTANADWRGDGLVEVPSGKLRFVTRDAKRILQQEWKYGGTAQQVAFWKSEWRDVPMAEET